MEKRLEDLVDTKRTVINEKIKNEELVKDLNEVNRLAYKADLEKKITVEAADRQLSETKVCLFSKRFLLYEYFHDIILVRITSIKRRVE